MTPQANKLLDDCFAHDRKRLRHAEALAILKERVRPVVGVERVALGDAAGRILATAAVAPRPVPAHTNAAVDGYSFAASRLRRRSRNRACRGGTRGRGTSTRGQAGAQARRRASSPVQSCRRATTRWSCRRTCAPAMAGGKPLVAIPPGLKRGANVRKAGEDVKEGESVLSQSAVLRPQDLSALASLGFGEVDCFQRLKVAIVSTGDEVVRAGAALQPGQVHDANAPMLAPLIVGAGAAATDLGVFPDDLQAVKQRLGEAARGFDVIITSGGASRGEEDHVVAALDALGKRHLWQLAIKPGRPMSFGQIGDCVVLGLPGNPVAVFVCFLLYVWPLLRRMGGAEWPEPRRFQLPALFAFPDRKVGRREFWRGMLRETPAGLAVDKFARDGSGLISGLRAADGLIDIPEDVPEVKPGDLVAFIPFTEFGIVGR